MELERRCQDEARMEDSGVLATNDGMGVEGEGAR